MIRTWSLPLILIAMCLTSCYERQQGCLDTYATNYDVTVDDPCEDICCEYPRIKFTLLHQWGDSSLRTSDTLFNEFDQAFRITDVRFYLSGVALSAPGGEKVATTARLIALGGEQIPDDLAIIRLADKEITAAPYRFYGKADSIQCVAGLDPKWAETSWESLPENHVLAQKNQLKNAVGAFASMIAKIEIFRPGLEDTQLFLSIPAGKSSGNNIYSVALNTTKGQNLPFTICVNYQKLLQRIDFYGTADKMNEQLLQNLNGFLIVK